MSLHVPTRRLAPWRMILLGIQHVIVMYTGCVTVPLVFGSALGLSTSVIGILVSADLLVAGIITVIQALGVKKIMGVRLPIVAGASFTAVTPMILIGQEYGLTAVYGAMIAAGVFGICVAVPFARVVRFFPAVVRGSAVTIIGLSLIGTAVNMINADSSKVGINLALAGGVILLIVLLMRFGSGFVAQSAVLISLIVGTIAAALMSMTDFSSVGGAAWFGIPQPFLFGAPAFPIAAVISMCIVMLVIFTESTAYMMAVAEMTGKNLTRGDLARGLVADGFSSSLAGVLTSFPDTVFAQNVSLVRMTGVRNRSVVVVAGAILVALGLVPKVGEMVASLPQVVVGAVSLVMFATVAGVGIHTLSKVRYEGTNNMLVVSLSLGIGMVPVVAPDLYAGFPTTVQIIAGGAITSSVIVAFALNLLFNGGKPETVDIAQITTIPHENPENESVPATRETVAQEETR
jgi:xanthine permease